MRTVMLELPEDLADWLEAMPAAERNHFATAALSAAIEEEDEELPPLTPEDMEAIGRGLADAEAGRFVDTEAFLAKLRQRAGLSTP